MVVAGRQMLKRARWLTARVSDIELNDILLHYQTPGGTRGSLAYDHLVLACGSVVDLNAVLGMLAYTYPVKTLGDAIVPKSFDPFLAIQQEAGAFVNNVAFPQNWRIPPPTRAAMAPHAMEVRL
jgi:NADH dehydrogenase FAD-containing subunit